jgi:hypothetical protein
MLRAAAGIEAGEALATLTLTQFAGMQMAVKAARVGDEPTT